MTAPVVRLPLQPVIDYLAVVPGHRDHNDLRGWVAVIAERTGASPRQVHRWHRDGMTVATADRVCCRLGLHLLLLYPQVYPELEVA